jgi:adenosylcobinamide-GDP ribazoletransferase
LSFAKRFARSLSYFTILPVASVDGPPEPGDVALLPFVGTIVGGIAGALAYGASRACSPRIGAAVAFAAPVALTGALHLDGFLDICDAAFAPVDLEKRREILRDPRHGSFAFAGGAMLATATYAAVRDIAPEDWPAALALAESTGRFTALVAARFVANPSDGRTAARAFATPAGDRRLLVTGATLLACAHGYGGMRLALAAATILGTSVPLARTLARQFGGTLSGDGYGFTIALATTAMLCASA